MFWVAILLNLVKSTAGQFNVLYRWRCGHPDLDIYRQITNTVIQLSGWWIALLREACLFVIVCVWFVFKDLHETLQ